METTTPPDKASGSDTPTNVHDFQKNVTKRLNAMTDRQDSIQALSMWMIHHKSECQKIASCWLAALKRGILLAMFSALTYQFKTHAFTL